MDLSVSDLLQRIYQCCMEPDRWSTVLDDLCAFTGARSAVVQLARRSEPRMRTLIIHSDSHTAKLTGGKHISDCDNPRMLTCYSPPRPGVTIFRDEEYFEEDDPVLRSLHQKLAGMDLGSFLGARIELSNNETVLLALHGALDAMPFRASADCANAASIITSLLPHLGQAFQISKTMERGRHLAEIQKSVLDKLSFGLLVVDGAGNIEIMNKSAISILSYTQHNSRPPLGKNDLIIKVERILKEITRKIRENHSFSGMMEIGGRGINVFAIPVEKSHHSHLDRILVILAASRPHFPWAQVLRSMYGLTEAEALVAAAICEGRSLNEYARQRGVSTETVRYQLKRSLAKTGSRRQADLIRLVYSSACSMITS